jgi:hypothetical protein
MLKCLILWEEGDTPEIKALSIGSLVWEDEVVLLREGLQQGYRVMVSTVKCHTNTR